LNEFPFEDRAKEGQNLKKARLQMKTEKHINIDGVKNIATFNNEHKTK
jgi:hypothetical protein